jgi:hypothetical protein
MKLLFLLPIFISICNGYAQTISLTYFEKRVLNCEFKTDLDTRIWPSKNNMNSLFLIRDGEYLLQRKNTENDEIIISEWENYYKNYAIEARLKLDECSGSLCAAGIAFNLSKDLGKGYIFEFNNNREFSIKKIERPGKYSYITGITGKNHWIKFKMLSKKADYNSVGILIKDNSVDLYINSFFAYNFKTDKSDSEDKNVGLYIGAGSEAIVTRYYIIINPNENNPKPEVNTNSSPNTKNPEIQNIPEDTTHVATYIINMKNQVVAVQKELKESKILLNKCREDNIRLNDFITLNLNQSLISKSKNLQQQYDDLKVKYDKLFVDNKSLQEFKKTCLESANDKELVNLLYQQINNAESEKLKLNEKISQLENELKKTKEK